MLWVPASHQLFFPLHATLSKVSSFPKSFAGSGATYWAASSHWLISENEPLLLRYAQYAHATFFHLAFFQPAGAIASARPSRHRVEALSQPGPRCVALSLSQPKELPSPASAPFPCPLASQGQITMPNICCLPSRRAEGFSFIISVLYFHFLKCRSQEQWISLPDDYRCYILLCLSFCISACRVAVVGSTLLPRCFIA